VFTFANSSRLRLEYKSIQEIAFIVTK